MEKTFKERAKELVSKMTLAEKIAQMKYDAPAIERLGVPAYNWWNEALHGVARAGRATVFPQAIGMAASFEMRQEHSITSTKNSVKPIYIRDLHTGRLISIFSVTQDGAEATKPMAKTRT